MDCTLITYTDGKRKIIYSREAVTEPDVATISYPVLTPKEIQNINEVTWDKVQEILSKY